MVWQWWLQRWPVQYPSWQCLKTAHHRIKASVNTNDTFSQNGTLHKNWSMSNGVRELLHSSSCTSADFASSLVCCFHLRHCCGMYALQHIYTCIQINIYAGWYAHFKHLDYFIQYYWRNEAQCSLKVQTTYICGNKQSCAIHITWIIWNAAPWLSKI